ncbi:hypothetical protein EHQ71_10635 [Leptospira levettii]|uniref:hypothetical protein n=1 Tax=Leptospira levettii TaxID=2023178 RepID=UPI0010829021|nr:hypothetical protein [Leptospira levettii]TGM30473.1 hypothetical protein EHQ71_10635 [Leptospira levettii]
MNDVRTQATSIFPTLFLPSEGFFQLPLEDRISMVNMVFGNKIYPSLELRFDRMDYETDHNTKILDLDFIVMVGNYLDFSLLGSSFFGNEDEFIEAKNRSAQWLDGRKEKGIQSFLFQTIGGNTREFFDNGSHEYTNSNIATKRQKLKSILTDSKFLASDLLAYHYCLYSSMERYEHVTEETSYSAWDLCFLQSRFISE